MLAVNLSANETVRGMGCYIVFVSRARHYAGLGLSGDFLSLFD